MALPSGNYNPNGIIEAFSAGVRDRLAREHQAQQAENDKAMRAIQQEHLKNEAERIKQEGETHKATINLAVLDQIDKLRKGYASGMYKPTNYNNIPVQTTGNVSPGMPEDSPIKQAMMASQFADFGIDHQMPDMKTQLNPAILQTASDVQPVPDEIRALLPQMPKTISGVALPEDMLEKLQKETNIKAQAEGTKAKLKAEAELPSKIALEQEKTKGAQALQTQKDTAQNARSEKQLAQQKELAIMSDKTRRYAADTAAAAQRYKADRGASTANKLDDAAVQNYKSDIIHGFKGIDEVEAKYRPLVENAVKSTGWIPLNKAQLTSMDSYTGLNSVMSAADDLIKQVPDATWKSMIEGHSPIPTELTKAYDDLVARAGAIVKSPIFANDKGNIALKEVDRALGAIFRPGYTKKDVMAKLENVRRDVRRSLETKMKGMSSEQKDFYREKYLKGVYNAEDQPMIEKDGHKYVWNRAISHYQLVEE